MVFYYTTQITNNKFYYNLYTKKKNDSDVNIKFDLRKKYKITSKFLKTKFLSKNILLLNVEKSILSSSDIYTILTCLMRDDKNFGNVSILKFYEEKNTRNSDNLFPDKLNFVSNNLYKKKSNTSIFGLIECRNTKVSKKIIRTINKLELIELNFLFELRFIRNVNKSNSMIIEHTNQIPINYFPKFTIKKNDYQAKKVVRKNTISLNSISLYSNNILEFCNKQQNFVRRYILSEKKIAEKLYVLKNFQLNLISCMLKLKKNPDNGCC